MGYGPNIQTGGSNVPFNPPQVPPTSQMQSQVQSSTSGARQMMSAQHTGHLQQTSTGVGAIPKVSTTATNPPYARAITASSSQATSTQQQSSGVGPNRAIAAAQSGM